MTTVFGPLPCPSCCTRPSNHLNLTEPTCEVTELLVTKLSGYQIISYQIGKLPDW